MVMVERSGNQHASKGNGKETPVSREVLIEHWKNMPEKVKRYPAGKYTDSQGIEHHHEKGARLLAGESYNIEVMDSCQTPWAEATVKESFKALEDKENKINVNVLERGFGMGIVATEIVRQLVSRGGHYTVIELNRQNAKYAREWAKRHEESFMHMVSRTPNDRGPQVTINVIEGEAYEETAKLVAEGRKFDVIVSDTFPLSEQERSVNDLLDLDTLKRCLAPEGIFTFFAHHKGANLNLNEIQSKLLTTHFSEIIYKGGVKVKPPEDYMYFQTATGPTIELPVYICRSPKF